MGKKFNFFDEDTKDYNANNTNTNSIFADLSPNQMYSHNGVIFISCKYKKRVNNSYITEPLIMKIHKNVVVDEYKPFNKIIYHFQLHNLDGSYYFICCGMDFNEITLTNGQKTFVLITSIKIFDAGVLLSNTHKTENSNIEPYLLRQINLLRNIEDPNKYSLSKEIPNGYASVPNIIIFAISDGMEKCAFSLDSCGQIVQITGFPNLVECSERTLLIKPLMRLESDNYVTNISYADIGHPASIIYATTTKELFYYKQINNEQEQLIVLNEETGAYSGCLDAKNDKLLIATSLDTQILEYYNLEMGPSNFFEGKKHFVRYLKNYILFVLLHEDATMFAIYDKVNKFFCYHNQSFTKIFTVCSDSEDLYAFVETGFSLRRIIKLNEKDNKYKFEIFYKKSFYDTALEYAKNANFDMKKIAEIYQKHGDHIYQKNDYQKAVEHYIMTINYLEPTIVIQKFLDGSKLDYLILYLEALHKENNFEFRSSYEMRDYTALLLNCYIKQKQIVKLKEFFDGKNISTQLINVEIAIEVCKDTNQIDLALTIAEKAGMFENYILLQLDYKSK